MSVSVFEIVKGYLIVNKYDGLYHEDGDCACEVQELAPCGEISVDCRAGYKTKCTCGDHDFHIVGSKETGEEEE